jgi:hypothetical protein
MIVESVESQRVCQNINLTEQLWVKRLTTADVLLC